jgi:hypothetical protein
MKAIEINARTDKFGNLRLDYPLNKKDSVVRVIILLDDKSEELEEENRWLYSFQNNPAFDFLNDPEEDIYSQTDGEPINDKE